MNVIAMQVGKDESEEGFSMVVNEFCESNETGCILGSHRGF
jgi:hypothetical protein